jgi:hypothetical protein
VFSRKIVLGISILLAFSMVLGIEGCKTEPLPIPPPLDASDFESPTPSPTVPTQTPVSDLNEISVTLNSAVITFPEKVSFSLQGTSPVLVKNVTLEYWTNKHSITQETMSAKVDFSEAKEVNVHWEWLLKRTGSIPPGVTIYWQWLLTDEKGETTTLPMQETLYTDTRFSWQLMKLDYVNIYTFGQTQEFVDDLADALQTGLTSVELNVPIPPERIPKVFIYRNSAELRDAILFEQEWTGAVAYPGYNIVLTAANSSDIEWAKRALPHEITHLLVGEAIFGPFGDIPVWLNEGLAEFSEGPMTDDYELILNEALKGDTLLTIKSLCSSFPTSTSEAHLAYAESNSVVRYLIDSYGWDKMRNLLLLFKEGATYDGALETIYSFDIDDLNTEWKSYLISN